MRVTLTVTSGPAAGKVVEFTEADTLLFGRATDAHVQILGDAMVSRNHFSLLVSERECRVRDLDSANGTYVSHNGRYLRYGGKSALPAGAIGAPDGAVETALQDGDIVSVGDTKMSVKIEAPKDATKVQTLAPDESERTMQQVVPPTDTVARKPTAIPTISEIVEVEHRSLQAASTSPKPTPPRFSNAPHFEGYDLLDVIGKGGMGTVFRARRTKDSAAVKAGRIVAIKTMQTPKGPNAIRLIDAFEREIRIQASLKHSHIVEQLDVVRSGPVLGVVLEFVDGKDLAKYVKDSGGRVALASATPLMLGVLSGLACAHAAGIVHRDLKPENIFLANDNGRKLAKVADFGLAKSYEASGKSLFEVAGTPPYWPREHITAYQSLYPASDVFSIAAVFYWMLTGVHARDGMSEMLSGFAASGRRPGFGDYTQVITAGKLVPIAQRLPGFPPAIAKIFDRALKEDELPRNIQNDKNALRAKLSEMRFPNAGAFKDALAMAARDGAK